MSDDKKRRDALKRADELVKTIEDVGRVLRASVPYLRRHAVCVVDEWNDEKQAVQIEALVEQIENIVGPVPEVAEIEG